MKFILKILGSIVLLSSSYYAYYVHFDYRFEEISKNKVYKSALIDPDDLAYYLSKYKIKTVIDLLDPGVQDSLNPAKQNEVDSENKAINAYNFATNSDVKHVHIPSGQVPTKETLIKFFEVLDDKTNYPVLIHCYHGTGRAAIYSAIYRIEYEKYKNEDAREKHAYL